MNAAISAHAGVVVNYDEIAGWWRVQDFTFHAFETAVVLIRRRRTTHGTVDHIGVRRNREPARRETRRP